MSYSPADQPWSRNVPGDGHLAGPQDGLAPDGLVPDGLANVRARFSSLNDDFVFLDAPGGTQTPDEVGAAVARVYREASGNTGAPYATSRRIDALVGDAREASARFLGCTAEEIIFGPNMTSLNYVLSRTLGRDLQPGDEIIVTRLDHDANVAPWLDLAQDRGLVARLADVHADTTLDLSDLERLLGPRTKVVAFPWASNATGTIVDARAVCDLAHQAGALAWVDAVQYAPHEPMDVRAIDADVLLCSAYKFCGPHVGICFGRRELLESWRPYKARPAPMEPIGHRFETGTLAYELLGGLLAAFAYLDSLGGSAAVAAWERQLGDRLLAGLPPGARAYGLPTMAGRVPTFLVNFPGIPSAKLSPALADLGFGVWSHGSYYAPGLHDRIAWGEALRIGLAHYNTMAEMDRFNQALATVVAAHGARAAVPGPARMTTGPVVRAADVHVEHAAAGARVRTLLDTGLPDTGLPDTGQAGPGLVRRLAEIPPGALLDGTAGSAGELWFVIGGRGRLDSAGQASLPLGPDRGLWIPPDMKYRIYAAGPADLLIDAVTLPAPTPEPGRHADAAATGRGEQRDQTAPQARDLRDCEVETTGDRCFRVLFGPGQGCAVATQFLGEIPAGRAPEHSHPYDEVVLVLEGEGVLHLNGDDHPLCAGTCVHLPPRQLHCLENTGTATMRVLGVFHPADSPAAKAEARERGSRT